MIGLLVVLLVVTGITVVMKGKLGRMFGMEGFQSEAGRLDCKGVTCEEGQFCQDNVCKAISPPYTNPYFPSGTA
jgi:hypothetical protein